MGCFRHIDEIMQWSASTNDEKQIVLQKADQRKAQKLKESGT